MDNNKTPQPGPASISRESIGYDAIQTIATKEPVNADPDNPHKKKDTICCNKCTNCSKKTTPAN